MLGTKLRGAWNRKLYYWWHEYNREYLSCAMNVPVVRLGEGRSNHGSWDRMTRTITISAPHIEHDAWLSVMDTLRHEMAHQYVDEILKVPDEPPHGRAFRETCTRLRCSARSSADDSNKFERDDTGEAKVLRVLKKVLSLAESPNEHEAHVAVQKARHLLVKYNRDVVPTASCHPKAALDNVGK